MPCIMTHRPSGPAYRVETQRLVLRCWEPQDAPLLQNAIGASLEHLREWMPWAHEEPSTLGVMTNRLRLFRAYFDMDKDYVYGIFNRDETEVLGGCGLHTRLGMNAREIGYWIHADHINQGLATEVAAALTKVALEIDGVDRVEIHCNPKNLASAAVARRLGFTHEATRRRCGPVKNGEPSDTMIWTMHADAYPESPSAIVRVSAYDAHGCKLSWHSEP